MPRTRTPRSFRTQLIAVILLLGGFGALPVIIVGKNSVDSIDAAAVAREKAQITAAVQRRFDDLAVEQRSSAIWDDAVLKVKEGDAIWMENNLGVWMQEYFGHDLSFVLDPALGAIYAAVDQETRMPEAFHAVAEPVLPLVEKVRELVLAGDLDPEEVFVTDYVALETGPALVSVVPIIPDTDQVVLAPQETYFHVAVDHIDAAYVASVTHGLALAEPSLIGPEVDPTSREFLALEDEEGVVIARLGWTASTPAYSFVASLSPALLVWLLGGTLLVLFLVRRLIHTSDELQQAVAHARFLALHDPLTRLPNRALFEDRLSQSLTKIDRGGPATTLLMLDLDRFKNVNDTLGHPAGDELIRQVGDRIQSRIRRSDTVARLGGDEFAVILVGEMEADALASFCETLIAEISRPFDLFGNVARVSASIGAYRAQSRDESADDVVRCADTALYHAKRTGRQRYCLFSEDMDARMRLQDRVERDLRADLATGASRLGLVYRPIFDRNEALVGVEADLRWTHPDHKEIGAELCFRIAEEKGFVSSLGQHVLDEACDAIKAHGIPKISLWVSPVQLHDTSFAQTVLGRVDLAGIDPSRLELRLPQEILTEVTKNCKAQLEMLVAGSVGISLDESATARFDLDKVRELGVGSLTVGRGWIDPAERDPAKTSKLTAMIALARAAGLRVTATGIRTHAEREGLVAMGCAAYRWDDRPGTTAERLREEYTFGR